MYYFTYKSLAMYLSMVRTSKTQVNPQSPSNLTWDLNIIKYLASIHFLSSRLNQDSDRIPALWLVNTLLNSLKSPNFSLILSFLFARYLLNKLGFLHSWVSQNLDSLIASLWCCSCELIIRSRGLFRFSFFGENSS